MTLVSGLGLAWQPAFGLILALYFYSHYFFASGAAHIGAMYTAFLAVAIACGTPGLLAALALGALLGSFVGGWVRPGARRVGVRAPAACVRVYAFVGLGAEHAGLGAAWLEGCPLPRRPRVGGASTMRWRSPLTLRAGQLSNVMGCLSTYGIGSAPPYYGAGYVPQSKWYQLGFLFSVLYLGIWVFAGGAWWKVLGLW